MNLLVESLRNQFLGLFFRLCCFFLLILNLLFFCHLLYFYCSLIFLVFSFYSLFSSFFLLFLLLFLPPWLFLLWSSLLSILSWTPCHLYFSYSSVNFKVMASKQWHLQNYTLLLTSNHINFCSLSVFLIINVYLYCIFYELFFIEHSIYISYVYWSFYFFQFEPLLLSKLQAHN